MAQYDAVAALRFADMCGIPLVTQNPRFLIKNSEQPAFLGQMIQKSLTGTADREAWLVYVGMACCFVPAARAELIEKEPLAALGSGDPSARRFWLKLLGKKHSLAEQVLACIASLAKESWKSIENLPYRVRRFTKDGLSAEYLNSVRIGSHLNVSFFGYLIAFLSMLALPVAVFTSNSNDFYDFILKHAVLILYTATNVLFFVPFTNRGIRFNTTWSKTYGRWLSIRRPSFLIMMFLTYFQPLPSDPRLKFLLARQIFDYRCSRSRALKEARVYKSIQYFTSLIK